ncbi:MAG: ROK family protein [Anaerolineales bacterium]|nr:ROK family protein [Anaerolineales bacterium]
MQVLGIDIGGSGIKGALVDIKNGQMITDRYRIPTPTPSKPSLVAEVVKEITDHFNYQGNIGCGFPAAIHHGVTLTAANVHKSWVNCNAREILSEAIGNEVTLINDADAAGLAEMRFGAGRNRKGVVFVITIGTGLGTAVFNDGVLVPNTELGHLELKGVDAEWIASDYARKRDSLTWKAWTKRFNRYLRTINKLFYPDLIILGGGGSKYFDKFERYLKPLTEVVPAVTRNDAGIIGAAIAAGEGFQKY